MRRLLGLLGDPDRELEVVLIAGTKGKGSTAAILAATLDAAGVRAGLFTSPHLQEVRERVRVGGALLPAAAFAARIRGLRAPVAALRRTDPEAGDPTSFELLLALALRAFADTGCRVAILEVGLGGRWDATNATDPAISIVTSIGYDHTGVLGTTLGAIATEKAGVIRRGRPALVAEQRPAAARAIRRACVAAGASCRTVAPLGSDLPHLAGAHQRQNGALASAAAELLGADPVAIARGLARAWSPGRFEVVGNAPTIVLDGAHNGSSAEALARTLRQRFGRRRIQLIVGLNTDKDARATLRPLLGLAERVTVTASASPRARDATELARTCRILGASTVEIVPDLRRAIRAAVAGAHRDAIIVVTGSLALVGEARTALGLRPAKCLWTAVPDRRTGSYAPGVAVTSRKSARNASP